MVCSKFIFESICQFGRTMVQGRKMTNYDPNEIFDLIISFERYFSKLSENHNIFEIGSTEFKLWLFKDVQLKPPPLRLINGSDSSSCHNVYSISTIFLERGLSTQCMHIRVCVCHLGVDAVKRGGGSY